MGNGAQASWPDRDAPDQPADIGEMFDAPELNASRPWGNIVIGALLFVLAVGWIAALAAGVALAAPREGLTPLRIAAWIGLGSGPLALLAVLYVILLRTGRREAGAYAHAAARLRADTHSLAAMLTMLDRRIGGARVELTEHGRALSMIGEEAGERMARTGAGLRADAEAFARVADTLDRATATARADLGVLVTDLPQASALTDRLAALLREAGSETDGHVRALTGLLAGLETQARAASETSGGAAARLAGQLDRIEASAAAADRRIEDAAGALGRTIDTAMAAAADAIEDTRAAVAGQSAALGAMVEQGQATIGAVGDEAGRTLAARLDALMQRIDGAGVALRGQDEAARVLLTQLEQAIDGVEARFAALGDSGAGHTTGLANAILALSGHADAVDRTLGTTSERADTLLGRVVQLREQADAGAVAICETIPAALARIRLHAEQSLQAIATAGTRADRLSETTAIVSERLAEADALLDRQRAALDGVGETAAARLTGLTEQTDALHALLARAESDVRSLSEGASGQLVEALMQVRDAAAQAADHARDALSAAIPRVAQRLGEAGARAMTAALGDVGREGIAAIGTASEQAIEGARLAADRLSRQLLTIAETSSAIEARIERNREDSEAHDEAGFARQLGLMIEALNSTAIDVSRILSAEVSDSAWTAYLKGDRGIFTRRAVKLLDGGEARAIAERYGDDDEFHAQVNRYVHDFEAMLRRTLAVREGNAVATTLLSSDVGKLYVALAQAIERLRR